MTKTDPILAVKDVEVSSEWYRSIFECKSIHGGKKFDILVTEDEQVLCCLHLWGEHEHPTMTDSSITPGNGLILYLRTDKLNQIRANVDRLNHPIEEDIHLNPNTGKKEFSFKDPDGYYWIVTEFHQYKG